MCDLTCKHVDLLHLKSLCVLCLAVLLLIYLPGNTGKHIFRSLDQIYVPVCLQN